MAHKIMKQYSISQADLMEEEDKITRAERGGMSTVNIWPAKESSRGKHQSWVSDLVSAIQLFFDCSAYSSIFRITSSGLSTGSWGIRFQLNGI